MSKNEYLYGIIPVLEALNVNQRNFFKLYIKHGDLNPRLKKIFNISSSKEIPIEIITPHELTDLINNKHHQGVILECSNLFPLTLSDFIDQSRSQTSLIIALDQIEDPHNLGAILRNAAFLNADALLLTKNKSAFFSPLVSKISAGAMEFFPVIQVTNLSETLKVFQKNNYFIVGTSLEKEAVDYRTIPDFDKMVLVLGNEGDGLRSLIKKRCDFLVNIPGSGKIDSLNVSATAAILINYFAKIK